MSTRDLSSNIKRMRTISPVAVGTTGTGKTGKPRDRAGYDSVTVEFDFGTITATNATFTVTVLEGDATGSMTSVADADLIGTEALAGIGATASRVSDVSKNVSKRIGYRGVKRYVQGNVKSTVTAGTPIAATVLLGHPHHRPVSGQA
jgi:hypothetical protein